MSTRKRSSHLIAAVGFAALVILGIGACASESPSRLHEVMIDGTSYSPRTLDVGVGDIVVWTNRDFLVHTVTANDGTFDSEDIASGESWRYEVIETGDLEYFCVYHPTMKGSLRAR